MSDDLILGENPHALDNETLMLRHRQFITRSTEHALAGDPEGRDIWKRAAERFAAVARRRGLAF
ncbi:hypothetical protein B2J88_46350 [Rhodococcus sp. SRB_17]|nr:hypothetical protein [Rhodococcus sp. SRB_17]